VVQAIDVARLTQGRLLVDSLTKTEQTSSHLKNHSYL
jgi:hypothetical protein